jgi:hypothetical protein
MDAIYENPIPALLVGLVVGSVLAVGYLNTRDRRFLIGVGAVIALVIAAIVLERSVKTDQELIAETLDQLASALQADGLAENSADEVLKAVKRLISLDAAETIQNADTNLHRAKITRARYSNLRVEINKLSLPPSAEVRFDATISGEGRPPYSQFVTHNTYPLEFFFKMVYEKDDRYDEPRWLIGDRVGWGPRTLGGNNDPAQYGFDTGEMVRQ